MTLAHGCHGCPNTAILPPQPATSGRDRDQRDRLRRHDVGQQRALDEAGPLHQQGQQHAQHAAEEEPAQREPQREQRAGRRPPAPTDRCCAAPATSGSNSVPRTVQTCGIAASEVRGSTRVPPMLTPSAGTTSLTSSHTTTSSTNAATAVASAAPPDQRDRPALPPGRSCARHLQARQEHDRPRSGYRRSRTACDLRYVTHHPGALCAGRPGCARSAFHDPHRLIVARVAVATHRTAAVATEADAARRGEGQARGREGARGGGAPARRAGEVQIVQGGRRGRPLDGTGRDQDPPPPLSSARPPDPTRASSPSHAPGRVRGGRPAARIRLTAPLPPPTSNPARRRASAIALFAAGAGARSPWRRRRPAGTAAARPLRRPARPRPAAAALAALARRRGPARPGRALLARGRARLRGPPRSGFAAAPGSSSSRRVSEIRLRASSTSSTFTRTTSPDLTTSRGSLTNVSRHRRDVHQPVLVHADVDERAERGDVGDDALQHHPGPQVGDLLDALGEGGGAELRPRVAAGLLQLGEDVGHRRQPEAVVDELLRLAATRSCGALPSSVATSPPAFATIRRTTG